MTSPWDDPSLLSLQADGFGSIADACRDFSIKSHPWFGAAWDELALKASLNQHTLERMAERLRKPIGGLVCGVCGAHGEAKFGTAKKKDGMFETVVLVRCLEHRDVPAVDGK